MRIMGNSHIFISSEYPSPIITPFLFSQKTRIFIMDRALTHPSADPEKRSITGSSNGDGSSDNAVINSALEKRVWRKMDLFILPVVTMFYLLSFLVSSDFTLSSNQTHFKLRLPVMSRIARTSEMQKWRGFSKV